MKEISNYYEKWKDVLLPITFGLLAIFVFFRVILQQIVDIQEVVGLNKSINKSIESKKKTINFFNSTTQEQIDSDFKLVTTALPIQKEIVLIFGELSNAAAKSNVKLGGFSLKVGDIYSVGRKALDVEKSIEGVPYLNILVFVSGDSKELEAFAQNMYKSLPLVEIRSVDISKGDAKYDVNFFYKLPGLRTNPDKSLELKELTPVEKQQIETLKSWDLPRGSF